VDFSYPWAFFDGASQNNYQQGGGGDLLYLFQNHLFKLKMGLGQGTSNYAIDAQTLIFAGDKGVRSIQIFGDSLKVINWSIKTRKCHNQILLPLLDDVIRFLGSFDTFHMHHVYRERNMVAYLLSKEGLRLDFGKWMITEHQLDGIFEYYHWPFIEPIGGKPSIIYF
jgi:ribonuclease HI